MKKIFNFFTFILFLFVAVAKAENVAAVSSQTCHLVYGNEPFILVLKSGEKLISSITKCIDDAEIKSASLNGIGAVVNPRLAYFDKQKNQYQYRNFEGVYELLGLNGNVTTYKEKHVVHVHIMAGDSNYQVIGGHLDEAVVGATAEITIFPLQGIITKKISPETGLPVIFPAVYN